MSPFHLASYLFIGGGFWLIAAAWRAGRHGGTTMDTLVVIGTTAAWASARASSVSLSAIRLARPSFPAVGIICITWMDGAIEVARRQCLDAASSHAVI